MHLFNPNALAFALVLFMLLERPATGVPELKRSDKTTNETLPTMDGSDDSGNGGHDLGDGNGKDGDSGNDTDTTDDRGGPRPASRIQIGTYNSFHFYGQGRWMEVIRRLLRRERGGGGGGGEGGGRRGGSDGEGGGRDGERGGESGEDGEEKKRNNYDEFPDEAREIPDLHRGRYPYGKVPFPSLDGPEADEDFGFGFDNNNNNNNYPPPQPRYPMNPWAPPGGMGGAFPVQFIPVNPVGLYLYGAGPLPRRKSKGDKKDKKGKKYEEEEEEKEKELREVDWTTACIYECGEGVPDGRHRNCDDCSMYYLCVGGAGQSKTCGGLVFNHETDQCDVMSSVTCSDVKFAGFPKTTSPSSMTSKSSVTSPMPRPWEERMEANDEAFCVTHCFGVPDGKYPSCYSCQKYTHCWWGSAWVKSCKDDEAFDPESRMCRPADQVECG